MKYTCDCINSIFFDCNSVKCGCSNTGGFHFISPFTGNNFDISEVNKKREYIVNSFKLGIIPEQCQGCYMLKEDVENSIDIPISKELDNLFISHWYHCNSACIYCCNKWETKLKITPSIQKSKYYDLLPTIKYLTEQGYIGPNTNINTIGGEPTLLEELDEILNELIKHSRGKITFLSNGIIYSNTIYKILSEYNSEIVISLDCGTSDMFKKIKNVDAFYKVIENIKNYVTANQNNKNSVILKYILIQGLNDTFDEIEKFINIAKNVGVNTIFLDIDHNKIHENKIIPSHWYDLFKYFKSVPNLNARIHDYCQQILDKQVIF